MKKFFYFILITVTLFYSLIAGRIKLASLYHNKGVELFSQERYQQAGRYFEKAIAIYPRAYQSHFELGNSYSLLNKHSQAIEEYLKAIALKKTKEAYANLVKEYVLINNYEKAYNRIEEAIKLFPQERSLAKLRNLISFRYALYLSQEAERYLDSEEIAEAVRLYQKAISVSYTVPTAYINLAVLYILQGENWKAERVLQDYIAIYSQDALGYKLLGDIYLRRNFYLSAIDNYQKAIEIAPSFAQAYNGIALAYDYLGYYSTALEMAQRAYRLKPSDEIVLYNLAKILRDNRKFEQALSVLLKLQKLNPEFPFLNESLAELYILLGRKEEAERFLEQEIAETKQSYQKYADRQNLLKLVYLYFMKKDYRSAQVLIEKAMKKGNDFPELYYFYGKIWEEEGNLIQASKEYEKAIRSRFGELARERYYRALWEQKLK